MSMINPAGSNYHKTITSELENFDTLGLVKPDFSSLSSLDLQIWEPESLAKGPSLAPIQARDMVRVGNPTWTAKDEHVLFQRQDLRDRAQERGFTANSVVASGTTNRITLHDPSPVSRYSCCTRILGKRGLF